MKTWEDVYAAICNQFGHETTRLAMARDGYQVAHQAVYFRENGEAPHRLSPLASSEYMRSLAEKMLSKPLPEPDENARVIARLESAK